MYAHLSESLRVFGVYFVAQVQVGRYFGHICILEHRLILILFVVIVRVHLIAANFGFFRLAHLRKVLCELFKTTCNIKKIQILIKLKTNLFSFWLSHLQKIQFIFKSKLYVLLFFISLMIGFYPLFFFLNWFS